MNKKFFIAWSVIFVAWMAGSFVVHGVLLHDDYARLPSLFRPEAEAQQYFPLMVLAHIIMAGAFAWIYSRGAEATPWLPQGDTLWPGNRFAGGRANLPDLLRRTADARPARRQADRV